MGDAHTYFSIEVEDAEWRRKAFDIPTSQMAVAISTKEFNECNSREKLHARLVQSLSVAEQAIPQTSIRQLSLDSPNSLQLQLCTAEGHIVSKSRLQKWREEASSGSGAGASVNHPIEVLLRHSDMFSKERVEMHEVKVNLRTATENETAGQAGVDPAIFSISEFIDNSLTALMSVPEDRPRVVDVYMGREKLVGRKDLGPQDAVMNRSTLSYIAIVDSGIGMKDFSPIARRGQVPKRMNEQLAQTHGSEEGMIREELKRPFLTDDDLSAFGEGCTKVMSDLGSYMYILTRPLGATNVKETLIDRHQWTDKFSATLESTSRASLSPDEGSDGPEYMPMSEWTRTALHKVPGATSTSILPRILSHVERVGCSEPRDGDDKGNHSFTAFILLDLHQAGAEDIIFNGFHRVCNTLKMTYYHFLGHSGNFMKTFNGQVGHDEERIEARLNKGKRARKEENLEMISRTAMKLHVFFHDGVRSRCPWDLLPDETIVDKWDCGSDAEIFSRRKEWHGLSEKLCQAFSVGEDRVPALRHRCLNDQPWKGWPTLQAQLVDYSAACEDEVSRSIRVLKTPLQVAHHAPANDLLQELQSFTFACTHAAWGQGHLPIVGVLQYVPKNQSRLGIPDMFGFPQGKRRSWRGKVNEDDLRGATRYPLLPAEQNRLAVWWNGRYSAFSKVDKSSNANTPLLPFFKLNDALLAILKTHFPKLYKVLTGRDATEKFKARDGDAKKKILQEANRKLSSVSREHIIGHMSFSDWKSYSSDEGRMPSLPPHKRRKSIAASDKVTSRFLPSEKFEGRSAQKSKTKQTIAPDTFQNLQDLKKCNRIFHTSRLRYTQPFFALRLLELQGRTDDSKKFREQVAKENASGPAQESEKAWVCFDAAIWLATCIRELDSQMDLVDKFDKHPWTKELGLNVFRSCVRTTRNGEAKFIQGDLIKVPKNFDLSEAPHGNLVARKKEAWGVIHAFTEPTSRNGEPVRAADRCVTFRRILLNGAIFETSDVEMLLCCEISRVRPEDFYTMASMQAALSKQPTKDLSTKIVDEYRRYYKEIQAHNPCGLALCFWPRSGRADDDMPSMLEYRSSKLDDIMVAILADAGKGCPRPHLSSFPGLLNGPGKFVNINTHFTLAPYEVGLGLQCKTKEDAWKAMPARESKSDFVWTSIHENHPCPKLLDPMPPKGAQVFRVRGLDQRLDPGSYRLLVRVRHSLLTGAPEQTTRGQGSEASRTLQVADVQVCTGVMGPINGQTSYMPRMKMSTIHPPKPEEGLSAVIPFNVLVGEPETISCKQLVACGPPHAKQMDGDAEVYLGEVQDRVRLELRVLDKWGNHLTDKRRVCAFIAETYATGYVVDLNWAQRVVEKHRHNPPLLPFRIEYSLRSMIDALEDPESTLQGGRSVTPYEAVAKHFGANGVVLDPVHVLPIDELLKNEACTQELLDAWLPQDGFRRAPIKLNMKLMSIVEANRNVSNVTLHVQPGFARSTIVLCPLVTLSNGDQLPAGFGVRLVDHYGFPASIVESTVADLNSSVMQKMSMELQNGTNSVIPLRLPVLEVIADVPSLDATDDSVGTSQPCLLGGIPIEQVGAAYSINVRHSTFTLSEPLQLQRLELTAMQWAKVRSKGGVPARVRVSIYTLTVSDGRGGRKQKPEWTEIPDSHQDFPFVIRPSAMPTIEIVCGGQRVPRANPIEPQTGAPPMHWQPMKALPGQAIQDVQIFLQGEDGLPIDVVSRSWQVHVRPPPDDIREDARSKHAQHIRKRKGLDEDVEDGGAMDTEFADDVPCFPPIKVAPVPQTPGAMYVSGMHAPFLVDQVWEYQVEICTSDKSSNEMPGGGVGILTVVAVPSAPVQWGIHLLPPGPLMKGIPVVAVGQPLSIELWLQDAAGNRIDASIPNSSRPLIFAQAVLAQDRNTDLENEEMPQVQLYVLDAPDEFHDAVTFDVMASGDVHFGWDGSKNVMKDMIMRCRGIDMAQERRCDDDGLYIQMYMSAQSPKDAEGCVDLPPENLIFEESALAYFFVRTGRPTTFDAKFVEGDLLEESYFGCVPVPKQVVSLFDAVGNSAPARKNVDFWAKCSQRGKVFHSLKLSKLPIHGEAYQRHGASTLQAVLQSVTLTDVEPPCKTEQFQLFIEATRLPQHATALHPEFTAQTQPKVIRPVRYTDRQGMNMTVKQWQPILGSDLASAGGQATVMFEQMRLNTVSTWACTARPTAAVAAADVFVKASLNQQSEPGTALSKEQRQMQDSLQKDLLANMKVRVIDNDRPVPAPAATADRGPAAPAAVEVPPQSTTLLAGTRFQPCVKDLSKARIVNVEALCSHPFDSALAICARAAKRPEALSASAKVQLRVVPAVLASVTVVPSNITRAATPEGFFTFMRGANRVGTHVLLQARDACGNALTRDVPEGLEGAGSLMHLKDFGAYLVPEEARPGRAGKVVLRCTRDKSRSSPATDEQLQLVVQPLAEPAPLPVTPEEIAADAAAFCGPCTLHVTFTAPSGGPQAREEDVEVGRASWVGLNVEEKHMRELRERERAEWAARVAHLKGEAQRLGQTLSQAGHSMNCVAREFYSQLKFLLSDNAGFRLQSVRAFLLEQHGIEHGSLWELEAALQQSSAVRQPANELVMKAKLDHALEEERQSTVLHCSISRSGQGGPQDTTAAAAAAHQLFTVINARFVHDPRGRRPGDLMCVFGFAAQCVSFDRDAAVRFQQQAGRSAGGPHTPHEFARRVRDLLAHCRRGKLGDVLVYGQSANTEVANEMRSRHRSLEMSLQPVANLMRKLQRRQPRQQRGGMPPNIPSGPNDVLVAVPRLTEPLLAAYHLLRPSMHFMHVVHEWGLHEEMWCIFDAIRYHIAADLLFVAGTLEVGNNVAAEVSKRRSDGGNNEVLCLADGVYIGATGATRIGGRNTWLPNDRNQTEFKMRGVCVPGFKPRFDADADVPAFMALQRLLAFPFVGEERLIQAGLQAHNAYQPVLQRVGEELQTSVAPPDLPGPLKDACAATQALDAVRRAAAAVTALPPATPEGLGSVHAFAEAIERVKPRGAPHTPHAAPAAAAAGPQVQDFPRMATRARAEPGVFGGGAPGGPLGRGGGAAGRPQRGGRSGHHGFRTASRGHGR